MQEYDWEIREEAERLFVEEGVSVAEISKRIDVPVKTLRRWSCQTFSNGERRTWSKLRSDYIRDRVKIKDSFFKLLKTTLDSAVETKDPRYVFAAISLLKEDKERRQSGKNNPDKSRVFLETLEFIANYFKEHDLEAMKLLSKHFDGIVQGYKEKYYG